MPVSAIAAVLLAALLHAGWNLVVKSSGDRLVAATSQVVLAALVSVPFVIWRGIPTEVIGFLLGSAVVQVVYLYSLASAYNHADLSFVYPIARGSAPLVIALSAFLGLSEPVSGRGWLALGLICGGVLAMGLAARSHNGLGWSLLTGLLIATYIIIDGQGVSRVDDVIAYTASLYCVTSVLLIPVVLATRGLTSVRETMSREWPRHLFAGSGRSRLVWASALRLSSWLRSAWWRRHGKPRWSSPPSVAIGSSARRSGGSELWRWP